MDAVVHRVIQQMDPFGENDIFAEMDVCVKDVSEWEMWDVIRTFYAPDPIPPEV